MAGSQVSTSVTIIDSLHGYQALSLTEYNTSAACSIAAGSVVEIAGAFFTFSADEPIEASTWTSITTATTAYITLTASGTAGSQIVVARYTATAPEWRDDFQGWYASVGSSIRVVGSVYKAEATNYANKYLYTTLQESKIKANTISVNILSASSVISSTISASSISSNGYPVIPYRITTQTYSKTFSTVGVFSTLTTLTTAFGLYGGYYTLSESASVVRSGAFFLSAGTIYLAIDQNGTYATVIITYGY